MADRMHSPLNFALAFRPASALFPRQIYLLFTTPMDYVFFSDGKPIGQLHQRGKTPRLVAPSVACARLFFRLSPGVNIWNSNQNG
jgi:hypothetical protein